MLATVLFRPGLGLGLGLGSKGTPGERMDKAREKHEDIDLGSTLLNTPEEETLIPESTNHERCDPNVQ